MQQKLDYIHNNPVVSGFVDNPDDWLFSSARDYAGRKGLLEMYFIEWRHKRTLAPDGGKQNINKIIRIALIK